MFLNVGVTDIATRSCGSVDKEYLLWTSLLKRCFDEKYLKWKPTYLGCSVSEDWLVYSNFKKDIVLIHGFGFDGWQLDKDILAIGNKIYSKETCCFVPREVNQFFSGGQSVLGKDIPKGVSYEKSRGLYEAYGSISGRKIFLGRYENVYDAKEAYVMFKKDRCLQLAEKWKYMLDDVVYQKLLSYEFL